MLKSGIGCIVGAGFVGPTRFIAALGNVSGTEAGYGEHAAKDIVEHVAPMAQHVENNAAAELGPVVPGWPLCGLQVALKYPVAKFAPHRQQPTEEAGVEQELELPQPGQEQLVLHDTMLDAGGLGLPQQTQRRLQISGDRLFAIDVFAGGNRAGEHGWPHLSAGGVKKHAVLALGQASLKIAAAALDAMRPGEAL